MSTQQQVLGNWNQLKGKVKEKWGQISDDDLQRVEGHFDQLVGLIQEKTGQARQEIETMVSKLNEETGNRMGQAASAARQYVDQAGEKLRGATHQMRERTMEGYEDAQEMVRRRPAESVAAAFGTGIVVGMALGIMTAICMRSEHWS